MRELTSQEVAAVSGARAYPERINYQFRDMVVGAIACGLVGGPVGFAVGLAAGAITGYNPR
jgi:uncharacterized protein YcfJ